MSCIIGMDFARYFDEDVLEDMSDWIKSELNSQWHLKFDYNKQKNITPYSLWIKANNVTDIEFELI